MALAVGAGAVAVMLQVFGGAGARAERAAADRLALMVAQSALAGAGAEGPLAAGAAWEGQSAGLPYRVAVAEWSEAAAGPGLPPALLVTAAVQAWPGGPELSRLSTIRLGAPPPPPPQMQARPQSGPGRAR